ncbi:F-box protein At3g07870-like [Papaver somniferum]|uniref:F-box protein At3g07870-like n=1 Tax=Papaver somniferum TaxID=3469 RepID=UPI000E6FBCD9|nr:F-box protein At3g07870-like [Papaver somniferum]
MGSNSWKNIQTVPYWIPHHQRPGVLSSGASRWFGKMRDTYSSSVIISLDMSDEKFKVLQLPKEPLESRHTFLSIGELKGCLSVVVEVAKARVEVWVMQDYRVEESWTKRYIITHERVLERTFHLQLMWGFENDEMLFTFGGKLGVYDPKSGSFREPNTSITLSLFGKCNYFESLVSLNSGTCVGGRTASSFTF